MKFALLWFCLMLAPTAASAQDAAPSPDALRERLERVENGRGHEVAQEAIGHARRALASAERSRAAGQTDASRRALGIADAAILLADRLAARERARNALADARDRKRMAQRRAQTAREALLHSVQRRDAAANQGDSADGAGQGDSAVGAGPEGEPR